MRVCPKCLARSIDASACPNDGTSMIEEYDSDWVPDPRQDRFPASRMIPPGRPSRRAHSAEEAGIPPAASGRFPQSGRSSLRPASQIPPEPVPATERARSQILAQVTSSYPGAPRAAPAPPAHPQPPLYTAPPASTFEPSPPGGRHAPDPAPVAPQASLRIARPAEGVVERVEPGTMFTPAARATPPGTPAPQGGTARSSSGLALAELPELSEPAPSGSGRISARMSAERASDDGDDGLSVSASGGRMSSTTSNELVGHVLDSYRLVELIGSGGMGEVYRAAHIRLGREVALKLLRPEYALRKESVARFFQEARAVNRIRHRNIVDVTDLDKLPDGTPFIIMELLEGVSLRDWITGHRGETDRVINIFIQICEGLAAAHEVDIIHRDLKPDNVMVVVDHNGDDLAKLLDFGIAKLINHEEEDFAWKTTEGFVMGTPAYMAPEQAGGLPIDARTDIYALGAIMYEMFTGEPVFTGKSAGEYVRKHLTEDPILPRNTPGGRDLDRRIESVIMRCLAKEPSDRYASAIALRRELARILAGEEIEEVSTTRPMRNTPTGRSRASALDSTSMPASSAERLAEEAYAVPYSTAESAALGLAAVDLPRARSTGRRILFSLLPLAVAGCAALGWFYMRPQAGKDMPVTDTQQVTTTSPEQTSGATSEATSNPGDTKKPLVAPPDTGEPGSNQTTSSPTPPTPIVKPIVQETRAITVRFESKPAAEVYELGALEAQCTTPCDVTLPADGSAQRKILISHDGYYPEIVAVDMVRPQKKIRVKLRRKDRSSRDDEDTPGPDGARKPDENGKTSGENGTTSNTGTGKGDTTGDTAKDPSPPADAGTTKPDPKDPTKDPHKVSPSDTLNPFKD